MSVDVYRNLLPDLQLAKAKVFGQPNAPGATQLYPLGTKLYDEISDTLYKYCQFSGSVGANACVSEVAATPNIMIQTAGSAASCAGRSGVSPFAATDLQFGWIAISGNVVVQATGSVAVGDVVAPDVGATGKVITAAVATPSAAEVIRIANAMGVCRVASGGGNCTVYLNRLSF
jgi:hypothetical protein